MKMRLRKHRKAAETASHRSNATFRRHIDKVPSLMGSTERRRNCYGGQLRRDRKSTNFKASGGSEPQEASS
ncbi:unnamed protein product [Schistosoma margrebowiei]|uniref:Uncharacterized protein n=1 Tax=Schistosoma margrebowiei TaxID=48269 RepID=A0A183MXM2_9TREM|nr:unnamed protein product [Schistosoma margrebowiei]